MLPEASAAMRPSLASRVLSSRTTGEWLAFALFLAILALQVFVPPIVGLSNNGDFGKVIGVFNLAAPVEDEYKFVSPTYNVDARNHLWYGFASSEQLVTATALALHRPFSKTGQFDLRWIGLLHSAAYLAAFFLLLPMLRELRTAVRVLLWALAIFLFADAMYAAWMNTFYMDTAAFVFLVLAMVLFLRAILWGRVPDRIGCVIAAMIFAAGKAQHAPLAIPAVLLILLTPRFGSRAFRIGGTVAILASAAVCWLIVPSAYRASPRFIVIFWELLPKSQNLDRDMAELGLDARYKKWVGTLTYNPPEGPLKDEALSREFAQTSSYSRLGRYFLAHPAIAYRTLRHALDQAGRERAPQGDLPRAAGVAEYSESQAFAEWSRFKRTVFENHGPRLLFFFLGLSLALLLLSLRHGRDALLASLCLVAMALGALLIGAFGDVAETTRHLFVFNALVDVMLLACITLVCRSFHGRSGRSASQRA
jgi:hypothetical protein